MCSISGKKVLLYDQAVTAMNELMNKKILIVDDEKALLKTVSDALFKEGFFNIYAAASCEEALSVAASQPVALMLLDVSLPDGSGEDRIMGLRLGADDYIVKPFLMRELMLRVKALLRRTYAIAAEEQGAEIGSCYVDFSRACVRRGDADTPLTAKELILIKKLWENRGRIVSFDSLCMAAWGEDYYGHENTLTVHIRRLREKLEDTPSAPKYLLTVRGLGYRLAVRDE